MILYIPKSNLNNYLRYFSIFDLYQIFLFNEIIAIFGTKIILRQDERTEDEIWHLVRATKPLKYFKEINLYRKNQLQQLHYQTCRVMKYISFQPGQIIFKEGQPANNFYIILNGTVHIYQKKKFLQIEIEQYVEQYYMLDEQQKKNHQREIIERLNQILTFKSVNQINNHISKLRQIRQYKDYLKETGDLYPDQFSDINYFFEQGVFTQNLITKQSQGEAFGELGLILEQPRSATVLAADFVELAQIDASSYKMILQSAQVSSINKRLQFLYEHFLPSDTKQQIATQYAYDFKKIKFTKGRIIYKQNEISDCFYIIYKGEVESYKVNENQSVKISRMGVGNIFGAIEFKTQGKREYTVIVVSEKVTLFLLKYYQFQKMLEETQSLQELFENHTLQKTQLLKDQIKRTMSVKLKTEQFEGINSQKSLLQQQHSKHFQSDRLLKKLVSQIDDYKKKGMIPTRTSFIKQQQQLQSSLMNVQDTHLQMKQITYKRAYLMPNDEEDKLKKQQKQSIILRSMFNDKDTSQVDRKQIISYQLMKSHSKTQSKLEQLRADTEVSAFSISKTDCSLGNLDKRKNSSLSPSKKIVVSTKHNLFRSRPNKFFLFCQNYLNRTRNCKMME
ncbi:unnamed protein product [Paramecium octaurelia]|uniref:Cyclic nucleotide-binding domain-containing protein n=1 Tax=Paramecium octaurelia TaxID=43137 RepID=A0A8S1WBZ0_PAROT|nr:unnamed protein product [Paramecium octaurelia]